MAGSCRKDEVLAAQCDRIRGVFQAEEMQATPAALVAWLNAHSDTVFCFLVDDNIVAPAQWQSSVEMTSEVLGVGEKDRPVAQIQVQELRGQRMLGPWG